MADKTKKKTKAKRKVGRPKRVFTPEQIEQMENYALAGCQNNTIATLMDIPIVTREDNFRKLLTKKRCERKLTLRSQQNKAAAKGNPALLIFLGKNYLDQADKVEEKLHVTGMAELYKDICGDGTGITIKRDKSQPE